MENSFNLLLITNSNVSSGAGVIARDFREAFLKHKIDTRVLVNQFSGDSDYIYNVQTESQSRKINIIRAVIRNKIFNKIFNKIITIAANIFKVSNGLVFKTLNSNKYFIQDIEQTKEIYSSDKLYKKVVDFKPDAMILLFPQNFITYKNIYELSRKWGNIPVFITLLDMAPITGGCHYTWDCLGYMNECSNCPAVTSKYKSKLINNLEFKSFYADKGAFNFVYSSDYLMGIIKKATISAKNNHYKIPLPTNEEYYHNNLSKRSKYRNELGVDEPDVLLFFGAMDLLNPRKGGKYLKEAISKILQDKDITNIKFLVVGNNFNEFEEIIPKNQLRTLDIIPPRELPNYYNAADIFLSTSIEDAGPMMVNQSLMCGTRVCAFEVGVALDMIKSNTDCGRCAESITSNSLYKIIKEEILNQQNNDRKLLRKKCADSAFSMTSKSEVSRKWIEIIKEVRNNR
ncbi:glycosyltransferase [uncultured Tenacibaculum sp.]|uniref:glycosyltransferase n=1 Tax=uncultured Tenacibaculum sp. TaxID=174713 RepID=UPI002619C92F|nr:glycosyltransferase [uncultured Tenacibaculum sp.]